MCHNDKEVNSSREHNNPKYHVPDSSFKILEAKIERTTKRNGHIYTKSQKFQHPSLNSCMSKQKENQ